METSNLKKNSNQLRSENISVADTEEGKGNSTLGDSKVDTQVDHAREFQDKKMRMTVAKIAMTRKIKRNYVKEAYTKIESVNEVLEKKLLKLNRAG